jgi:hypothetical protein
MTQKLYDDIRAYAISEGAPSEVINQIVDPWAIKLLHNAMLYSRGRSKDKNSHVVIKKVNKIPKKIVKTTNSPVTAKVDDKSASISKAEAKFKKSGSQDDAVELLMSRWSKETG